MAIAASDLVIGALMLVCGLVGLILGAGAVDDGIYVFGLSLFGFSFVFILGLIRRHFDTADTARAGGGGHG